MRREMVRARNGHGTSQVPFALLGYLVIAGALFAILDRCRAREPVATEATEARP